MFSIMDEGWAPCLGELMIFRQHDSIQQIQRMGLLIAKIALRTKDEEAEGHVGLML